jgi:hypothetical protein
VTTSESSPPTADASGRLVGAAPPVVLPPAPTPAGPPLVVTQPLPNNLLLRQPDATRGDAEADLVAAHDRARRDALARLATWLPDLPVDELATSPGHLGPRPVHVDPALGDRIDLLALVDRLLAEHHMGSPKLVVATDGEPEHKAPPDTALAPPVGRFDHPHALAGPFASLLADGVTVVVHAAHFHDAALADLADALSVALETQVGANLYVSRGDALGFGPHWDDHDVLIVQGVGEKRWQVYEPLEPSPVRPVVGPEIGDRLAWDGTLAPGNALYVPRGWGHRVSGSPELAVHATVTLQRLRYDQVAGYTAGMGGFWPLFRADVPYDREQAVVSYAGSLYDEPGRFREAVAELGGSAALEHGVAQWLAKLPPRRRGRLSTTVAAVQHKDWRSVVVQGSFPGGVVLVDEKADPRLITSTSSGDAETLTRRPVVAVGGRLLELDDWALPALARLVEGKPVAVGDLPLGPVPALLAVPEGADPRSLLAAALVTNGVVDVVGVGDGAP